MKSKLYGNYIISKKFASQALRFHREIPFLKRKENSNIDTKELLTCKIDDNRNDH